jgi:YD repeat-containing protein
MCQVSPDTGTAVYQYDARGDVTSITDGRGVVTNLNYDNAGRLLTKQYPAAPGENITYTWDSTASGNNGAGRITTITDASGSIQWTYDTLGRIVQETKTTAGVTYTIGYAYDAAGNITQITYPSGRIVSYARDVLGRISGVTTQANATAPVVTLASATPKKWHGRHGPRVPDGKHVRCLIEMTTLENRSPQRWRNFYAGPGTHLGCPKNLYETCICRLMT